MQIKLAGTVIALWTADGGLKIVHVDGCTEEGCAEGCPMPAWQDGADAAAADRTTFNLLCSVPRPDRLPGAVMLSASNGPRLPRLRPAGGSWGSAQYLEAQGHAVAMGAAVLLYGGGPLIEVEAPSIARPQAAEQTWAWDPDLWAIV